MIEVRMIFDDVQFGIDVREARNERGLRQQDIADAVGYKDAANISAVECATNSDKLQLRRYMAICNFLGLNPMHYWDCESGNV